MRQQQVSCLRRSSQSVLLAIAWVGLLAVVQLFKLLSFLWTSCSNLCNPPNDKGAKAKVVVVGGGFAGAYATARLEDEFDVSLVDPKQFSEFTPSVPRALVDPDRTRHIQVAHAHYIRNPRTELHFDKAASVDESSVTLESGGRLPFDYLLVCTGSTYSLPFKETQQVIAASRADEIAKANSRLRRADSCIVVGGGPTGVEVAAEIAHTYPDKTVTLVQSGPALLGRSPPAAIKYAEDWLKRSGVRIVYGERLLTEKTADGAFQTDKGTRLHADLLFLCTGIKPNSSLLQKNFADCLDRGFVKVEPTLQMVGHSNILIAGDVTATNEEKLAQTAEARANVCVNNIKLLHRHSESGESKRQDVQLETYEAFPKPMLVSLGPYDGILIFRSFVLTGMIPSLLKEIVEWKTMVRYQYQVPFLQLEPPHWVPEAIVKALFGGY